MYRNQELPAALARAQLLHLDEYNRLRIENAEYLTRELAAIPGVIPPVLPAGLHPRVLHVQRALRPAGGRGGLRAAPLPHRRGEGPVQGGRAGRPVADHAGARPGPVPEQARLRRHGLPLDDQRGQGHPLRLRPGPLPAWRRTLCDTYTIVHGIHAPNGPQLMDKIVAAFHKVFADLDRLPWPTPTTRCIPGRTASSMGPDEARDMKSRYPAGACSAGSTSTSQERSRELRAPEEDRVLVKVRACGVCGTDVNFVRDWTGRSPCPWATRSPPRSWRSAASVPAAEAGRPGDRGGLHHVRHLRRTARAGTRSSAETCSPWRASRAWGSTCCVRFNSLVPLRGAGLRPGQPDRAAGRVPHRRAERRDPPGRQRAGPGQRAAGADGRPPGAPARRRLRGDHRPGRRHPAGEGPLRGRRAVRLRHGHPRRPRRAWSAR